MDIPTIDIREKAPQYYAKLHEYSKTLADVIGSEHIGEPLITCECRKHILDHLLNHKLIHYEPTKDHVKYKINFQPDREPTSTSEAIDQALNNRIIGCFDENWEFMYKISQMDLSELLLYLVA